MPQCKIYIAPHKKQAEFAKYFQIIPEKSPKTGKNREAATASSS
jgi:hypothetical protein